MSTPVLDPPRVEELGDGGGTKESGAGAGGAHAAVEVIGRFLLGQGREGGMDGEALLQRSELGLGEGVAQRRLTDQEEGKRRSAVEVEIGQQPEVVEGIAGEAVGVVEDEDLGTVGACELVEDGLGGLGRGAFGTEAVADGELADEAERAAGA